MNRRVPPPVVFAMAAIAMWWIGRNFEIGQYSFSYGTELGILLIAIGLTIVGISLRSFAVAGTTPNPIQPKKASELVTSGIYSISRNPMYLGDAIALAGIAVWVGSVLNLLPLAIFIAYIDRFQIAAEEQALAVIFGDHYAAYCRRVRRWL